MKKIAFFDLDGTLIPGASCEKIFIKYLFQKGMIHLCDIFRTINAVFANIGSGWVVAIQQNKYYLKGKKVKEIEKIAQECFNKELDHLVPPEAKERIKEHKSRGDLLIIISGAPHFIVEIFSHKLGFDDCKGTNLASENGIFTGKIHGIHPFGKSKVEVLESFIKKYSSDLNSSTVYANSFNDRFILEIGGNPVAVNPDRKLRNYCKKNNWKRVKW